MVAIRVDKPAAQPTVLLLDRIDELPSRGDRLLHQAVRIGDDEDEPTGRTVHGVRAGIGDVRSFFGDPELAVAHSQRRHHAGLIIADSVDLLGLKSPSIEVHGLRTLAHIKDRLELRHGFGSIGLANRKWNLDRQASGPKRTMVTILLIVIVVLLLIGGGGYYWRGRGL